MAKHHRVTNTVAVLERLERWYAARCDGDWEHQKGVSVETLDNPGWQVRIDLDETSASATGFERIEIHRSETDWLVCWLEDLQFRAACGPLNLREALTAFVDHWHV